MNVPEKDLKKNVDNLNNNEGSNNKNENFLRAKKQVIYAAVSFASSTALAVSASLTIFHLAICISLAVTALTFLAVGCYCSYKANTALNNVKIENDSYRIAA